ncbi:hypothetical protein HPB49_006634 [Dermacentor silvarum]|uniref:Uncharacterized protein n=1 Tax=Dermacentor silvarum TaxID=543639 RepID=A0ACB8CQ99_DERSI|nr:hypothetical protein HPB49_006634 [Dermacentor silvarum]
MQIYLGGLSRFMAKLDVVRPSALVRDVDAAAQLPLSTEGVRRSLGKEAKDIKLEVEYFGHDLVDLVDRFAASWNRDPDALNSKVSERYGHYVSVVEPFVSVNSLVGVGLSTILFLIVTFYSTGIALFNWSSDAENRHIKSSWCLFLGVHVFWLPFAVGMIVTILGLITGFTLQRCACDVVADPTTPAFKDVLRFGMKVAREWEIINGTRQALSHVNVDTVQDIFKRFVKCRDQPLSLYKLLGDQLMANITRSVGRDWAFSWLWSDVQNPELSEKLAHFADPKAPLVPKGLTTLTDLESKMKDVKSLQFEDLHVASYLRDATMKQKISDVLQQVKKTMDEYAKGEPKKKELMQILEEIVALKMVEGKSIDMKEEVGRCGPAYAIYESALNTVCGDLVAPFNSMWVCLLTYLLVGVVALVLALSLSTLYMRAPNASVQPTMVAGAAATPYQEPGPGGDSKAVPGTVPFVVDAPTAALGGGQAEHPARHVVYASGGENTSRHQRKHSASVSMSLGLLSSEAEEDVLVRPFTCGIDTSRPPALASPGGGVSFSPLSSPTSEQEH